jgi:tRNA/tmRNA/rRNA uracil-C5-methylase (TrmA/RlmC/RlmD family)
MTFTVGARIGPMHIDSVDDEGRGRALWQGWNIAVRGALPGDVCERAVVERVFAAHRIVQARLEQGHGSTLRSERTCAHAGPCAGCPLHGVEDTFAASWRHARVVRAFADANVDLHVPVDEVRASMSLRQKIKLALQPHDGRLRAGLFVPHSHVLHSGVHCAHVEPALRTAAVQALSKLQREPPHTQSHLRALVARAFREGVVVMIVRTDAPTDDEWARLVAGMSGVHGVGVSVVPHHSNAVVGGKVVRSHGSLLGTPLHGQQGLTHVDAFCQADGALADVLVDDVRAFVASALSPGDVVVDAYAGSGAFAARIATPTSQVIAIEEAAVCEPTLSLLPQVQARIGKVEDVLPTLHAPVAAMVLDPPKKGLAHARDAAVRVGARRVALVACDPDAGATDARAFVQAGYRITRITPYALFPGSIEVETVVLLERAQATA